MPDARELPPTVDAPPGQDLPDLTNRLLGDYQLLRRLGVGGMGQVYLARQLSLKRDVAIKLLRNELANNPTALKRFQAEAEAVARLNHPNIVHIHQIGEHDGLRYMVLEFVEGRNLRDYLLRKGPPDLAVTLSIVRQVVLGLQTAHEEGIIHRDIKPENILVTRRVEVKVTDFGLSRFFASEGPATNLTQSGVTLGTPLYMSPEQVQGHTIDHRTDIYSLGVTCYHLLAGEPPFRGATAFDVALKHVQEQPKPLAELRPDLPADLCGMVHKMMAKNPNDRYQTAREIIRDLVKVRDGISVPTNTANGQGPTASQAVAHLSLSASVPNGMNGLPMATEAAPQGASGALPVVAQPLRWGRWVFSLLACAAAATGGAFAYLKLHHATEATAAAPATGLLEVRIPKEAKIVTTRERELLSFLTNRETKPDEVVKASVELGLLYMNEHRWAEANERFKRLEKEDFSRTAPLIARQPSLVGRLGQAVVLAYWDLAAQNSASQGSAAQSNEAILKAVVESAKGPKFDKIDRVPREAVSLLLRYPNLAQTLGEALNRNVAALGKAKLDPILESLRVPPKTVKKD